MAHRYSTLWGLVALGLVAVTGLPGPASASESRQVHAPLRQRAQSTAVSVGGDAFASATNRSRTAAGGGTSSGNPATLRTSRVPEIETAVAAAVSVGGKSKAVASNNGPVLSDNGPGSARPLDLTDGRVPNTSSAVSVAVTIGGVPILER
jgi:hypothetical protein